MTNKCVGMPSDPWIHHCHRPATVEMDGMWYCPQHAAGKRRSKAHLEKWNAEVEQGREHNQRAQQRAKELALRAGFPVRPLYLTTLTSLGGYSDNQVIVRISDLEQLLRTRDD